LHRAFGSSILKYYLARLNTGYFLRSLPRRLSSATAFNPAQQRAFAVDDDSEAMLAGNGVELVSCGLRTFEAAGLHGGVKLLKRKRRGYNGAVISDRHHHVRKCTVNSWQLHTHGAIMVVCKCTVSWQLHTRDQVYREQTRSHMHNYTESKHIQ
jgi:hypothetical protein